MEMNLDKTKGDGNGQNKETGGGARYGQELEQVNECVYLGSTVTALSEGGGGKNSDSMIIENKGYLELQKSRDEDKT